MNRASSVKRSIPGIQGNFGSNKKSVNKLQNMQEVIKMSKVLFTKLEECWNQGDIPLAHQTKYIEAIQEIKFDQMNLLL